MAAGTHQSEKNPRGLANQTVVCERRQETVQRCCTGGVRRRWRSSGRCGRVDGIGAIAKRCIGVKVCIDISVGLMTLSAIRHFISHSPGLLISPVHC